MLKYQIAMAKQRKQDAQQRRMQLAREQHKVRQVRDAVLSKIMSLSTESAVLKDQLSATTEECMRVAIKLQRFMQLNAINDCFYVWYNGPYGTINGFRLGNLPLKPVDWNEINAALGQGVLAIATVAAKAKYEFKRYSLSPMGSFSKIFKAEDKKTPLGLYTDGTFQLFPKRNFNAALTGFLSCIHELGEYTRTKDPTLQLPYAINVADGKIHDLTITLGADDEMWARALKFLLTDIKWVVAWACKHCNSNLPAPHAAAVSAKAAMSPTDRGNVKKIDLGGKQI